MKHKSILTAVVSAVLVFVLSFVSLAAEKAINPLLADHRGFVISVARFGDCDSYPACSYESIWSCGEMGVNMVSVPVYMTADNVPVIMKSNSLLSVCTDGNGNEVQGTVESTSLEQLKGYRLRNADLSMSNCAPITLEEAVTLAKEKDISLILDDCWQARDAVYDLAVRLGAVERVILRTEASAKEITAWTDAKPLKPQVVGVYIGGIVFSATSKTDKLFEHEMDCVQLGSGNYFSVVFDNIVTKRFRTQSKGRAMVATYDKSLCGKREDSVTGWDDLVSRGYSVIETARPAELVAYIKGLSASKARLSEMIGTLEAVPFDSCSAETAAGLKSALAEAKKALTPFGSSVQVERAIVELKSAGDALSLDKSNEVIVKSAKLNVTPGKLIAVLFGAVLVVAGQLYIKKKTK